MEMFNSTQSRGWLLTVNNPLVANLDHDTIMDKLQLSNPDYVCMADEIATTGTPHTHVYFHSASPVRFGTIKKRFPTAHIEKATGTAQENRDYIRKEGKWANTVKAETKVEGSFLEFGTPPTAAQQVSPKMAKLIEAIESGMTTPEIIRTYPSFALRGKDIDALRDNLLTECFMVDNRMVKVSYIYGQTGTGKTRGVMDKYPANDVCRITDYGGRNGVHFDSYHRQNVLVFDEFRSQIPIASMLNYLDIYPVMLPARYQDKVACYNEVYIISNIPLEEQYRDVQRWELETWHAFLRRIDVVVEYRKDQNGNVERIEYEMLH